MLKEFKSNKSQTIKFARYNQYRKKVEIIYQYQALKLFQEMWF